MTKGDLIAILQEIKYSSECPILIETSSDYLWVKEVKYDPKIGREGLGSIKIIAEEI